MSHTGSDGSNPSNRIRNQSYRFDRTGENVAYGQPDAETVIESWLNSPGHCRNIMNPNYTDVAVAVKRSEGNNKLYWTMKLGTTHIGKPEDYVTLELDKEAILERLNAFRGESKICGESIEFQTANIPLHWYDGLERAALAHSQDMAENLFLEERGTRSGYPRHRVPNHTESRLGIIGQAVTKGGADLVEVLDEWLKEHSACRIVMSQANTQIGISAVQSTEDESVYYWTMKTGNGTPDTMFNELREYFEDKEISVYGLSGCSLTRSMHNNLTRIGIDHSAYLFDDGRSSNRDKYMAARRNSKNTYRGARGFPLVVVDNDAFYGFSSPAGLYQKMQIIEENGSQKSEEETFELTTSADDENQERSVQDVNSDRGPSGGKTSLTVGYINDELLVLTDQFSERYFFDGESVGVMLSSDKSYILLGYGIADANEDEGEIRSLSADLSFGGNITLFRNLAGLPADIYLPLRINLGYRNLTLIESDDRMQLIQAGLGAGIGGNFRIPLGIPAITDGLSGYISLVRSVGGIGELSGITASQSSTGSEEFMRGIRLMRNTDLNIEGRVERLFGWNTGITLGLTLRTQAWTEAPANNASEIIDAALGRQDDFERRGKQLFLRAGINW